MTDILGWAFCWTLLLGIVVLLIAVSVYMVIIILEAIQELRMNRRFK